MNERVLGAAIKRLEDPELLTGSGRFVDDIHLPGMLHAAFVRSPLAHAAIIRIDAVAARAMDGVTAVYTAADLKPHLVSDRIVVGLPSGALRQQVDRPVLASDEVCHVGEAVAIVVADSRYVAEDAAAAVAVDYDSLPSVADCRDALAPGAPPVHRNASDNLAAAIDAGYGDVAAAFAGAAHVFHESLWQHRGVSQAMECRGAVADFDRHRDHLTLWASTQMPHAARRMMVALLGRDENRMTVIAPNVGGGFGPKLVFYPEDAAIVVASLALGRPVKWIEDRREHFVATTQERDQLWDVEIAVEADGRLRGVRGTMIHDHGAYTARGVNLAHNAASVLPGPYELPAYRMACRIVLTNKIPVTPVRGAGHPQGAFAMERCLDRVARELGIDRAEIRRRNMIPADRMPYERPLDNRVGRNIVLDSGDYPGGMEAALEAADYAGFPARQAAARVEGRYLGFGIGNYIKGTGRGPFESATVRIGPSGRISVYTGATAIGQGTRTMLAQICAEQFGVAAGDITVVGGDTSVIPIGIGTSNSRITVRAGNSVNAAAIELRAKIVTAAAQILEAAETDLELDGGRVRVRGVPDLSVSLGEISDALSGTVGYELPEGLTPGLEATANLSFEGLTYSSGTTAVELEVDAETGAVTLDRYIVVHDAGRMINPMMVDGQVIGGAVHGIGNALFEAMIYDADGQPQTMTLAEYVMPTAPGLTTIEVIHRDVPSPQNPRGVKGVGESGTVPATAAIISGIENALSPFGVRISETPLSPARIVALIAAAKTGA